MMDEQQLRDYARTLSQTIRVPHSCLQVPVVETYQYETERVVEQKKLFRTVQVVERVPAEGKRLGFKNVPIDGWILRKYWLTSEVLRPAWNTVDDPVASRSIQEDYYTLMATGELAVITQSYKCWVPNTPALDLENAIGPTVNPMSFAQPGLWNDGSVSLTSLIDAHSALILDYEEVNKEWRGENGAGDRVVTKHNYPSHIGDNGAKGRGKKLFDDGGGLLDVLHKLAESA